MRKLRSLPVLVLLSSALPAGARAQKATGEIHGTGFDPSHTVASKAEASVTDTAARITKTTNSGPDGSYPVPNLLDGAYTLGVTAPGFEADAIGKGRAFAISSGVLNRMFGGWSITGIWTLASGRPGKLTSGERAVNANSGADSGVMLNALAYSQLSSQLNTCR